MDLTLYRDINGLSGHAWLDGIMKFVTNDTAAILALLVALVFLIPWAVRRLERRTGAVTSTLAAGLALLVAQPISHLVDRVRPYAAHPHDAHLLIHRSADASFPSDHATGAFALAVGVFRYDRRLGSVLLVLATLLAFSRVYVGTHYPGDVVAGALLGAGVALLLSVGPLGRLVRALAVRCSALWEAVLGAIGVRRPARQSS